MIKFILKYKWILVMLTAVLLAPVCINYLMAISFPGVKVHGDQSDWIAFFGNYSGGIIGGIITLIGLRITLQKEKANKSWMIYEASGPYEVGFTGLLDSLGDIIENKESVRENFNNDASPQSKGAIAWKFNKLSQSLRDLDRYENGLITASLSMHYVTNKVLNMAVDGCELVKNTLETGDADSVIEVAEVVESSVRSLYDRFVKVREYTMKK